MNNQQDFISESTASQLAGVSPTTLSRFVEAGYLRVSSDTQGQKNYLKSEICGLFAVSDEKECSSPEDSADQDEAPRLFDSVEVSTSDTSQAEVPGEDSPEQNDMEEKVYWAEALSMPAGEINSKAEAELTRLRNISEMQDKILSFREKEIEELRKERDWLRTRVERLEEKSERDQMLLLAETQTIKRLVNISQEKKQSSFRNALEWMGILPASQPAKEIRNSNSKVIDSN